MTELGLEATSVTRKHPLSWGFSWGFQGPCHLQLMFQDSSAEKEFRRAFGVLAGSQDRKYDSDRTARSRATSCMKCTAFAGEGVVATALPAIRAMLSGPGAHPGQVWSTPELSSNPLPCAASVYLAHLHFRRAGRRDADAQEVYKRRSHLLLGLVPLPGAGPSEDTSEKRGAASELRGTWVQVSGRLVPSGVNLGKIICASVSPL